MSNFNSRVRSRLYKRGYQGFTKDDFTEAALETGVGDIEAATDEELKQAVEYLINKQSSQVVETTVEEQIEDVANENGTEAIESQTSNQQEEQVDESAKEESTGELSFTNNFEKAGAIDKVFGSSGITASDAEVLQISGNIENTFESEHEFIMQALNAWEQYQLANIDKQFDEVSGKLATIRTNEVSAVNKMAQSMSATAEFIDGVRSQHRDNFTTFIERMKRS